MVRIVFWKALKTSKIKIIDPSVDAIVMMIWSDLVLVTGAWDGDKSNTSMMDDKCAHVLEYRSYWLSIYVVLTLNYILECIIISPVGNDERYNGALNVVDFSIFS